MKIYTKEEKDKIINGLINNELFAIKTDTVYGIMALATKENELKINKLKNSSLNKKISVIFPNKENLFKYIKNLTYEKLELINDKLPGPYTFIVNLDNFSNFNREDFGVRITTYKFLQDIIKETGPLLATSCNITSKEVLNSKEEIEKEFKDTSLNLVLDTNSINKSSTIIDIRDEIKVIRN